MNIISLINIILIIVIMILILLLLNYYYTYYIPAHQQIRVPRAPGVVLASALEDDRALNVQQCQ